MLNIHDLKAAYEKTIWARNQQQHGLQSFGAALLAQADAATYRATVDVPARFRKSKSVGAVFGLTCPKYQSGEIDRSGRISRCGDEMMRVMLCEAAQSMLRSKKWSWLKAWAMKIARRRGGKRRSWPWPADWQVAQIGAVIGREFSYALLAAVVRKPEGELQAALDRLVHAGLLFRQGIPPHADYLFKHALLQDAAHGNRDGRCTPALPKPLKTDSVRLRRTNRSCSRAITPRQGRSVPGKVAIWSRLRVNCSIASTRAERAERTVPRFAPQKRGLLVPLCAANRSAFRSR
jgi:hypothetical protein